jgi:hypothetical protein
MIFMSERLYRVRQSDSQGDSQGAPRLRIATMSELTGALYADAGMSQQPDSPRFPRGEWYCENPRCTVREVRISDKYLDGKPPTAPPIRHCPACGQRLKFHGYLRRKVTLLPITTDA